MIKETPVILSKSVKGKIGCTLPALDLPELKLSDYLPKNFIRQKKAKLPEVSEPEVMRHFVNLSTKNHHVDKDFYPLGSCTMKYNPKINDSVALFDGYAMIHPNQPENTVQ